MDWSSKIVRRRVIAFSAALLVLAGSAVVYMVDPAEAAWMPKCPWHALTGLDCPSCGSTRAFHHILHGEVIRGLGYNPMAPVLWALAAMLMAVCFARPARRASSLVRLLAGAYIVVYIVWGVVRNLVC
ncbi:MAG: DUF2752 domain-containing protein [Muribaculaceae bacterium]|nr:DUF2752 domain-containing protein [Muribaculaceae bacterium]